MSAKTTNRCVTGGTMEVVRELRTYPQVWRLAVAGGLLRARRAIDAGAANSALPPPGTRTLRNPPLPPLAPNAHQLSLRNFKRQELSSAIIKHSIKAQYPHFTLFVGRLRRKASGPPRGYAASPYGPGGPGGPQQPPGAYGPPGSYPQRYGPPPPGPPGAPNSRPPFSPHQVCFVANH
ncbi:hypothetical protein ACJJTC_013252 [Scirpophaga incertulas]